MTVKRRNLVVLAMIKSRKRGGAHGKSKKAERLANRVKLQKDYNNQNFD